jgi:hypothetical protein
VKRNRGPIGAPAHAVVAAPVGAPITTVRCGTVSWRPR